MDCDLILAYMLLVGIMVFLFSILLFKKLNTECDIIETPEGEDLEKQDKEFVPPEGAEDSGKPYPD